MTDSVKQTVTKAAVQLTHDQLAEILQVFCDWPRAEWPETIALLVEPAVVKADEWLMHPHSSQLIALA